MEKLITPLGSITIYNNGFEIDYNAIKLDNDTVVYHNIDGRYKIAVEYESDKLPHLISCVIDDMDCSKTKCYPESGERIGNYDYDSIYLDNGIGYSILPSTTSHELIFGIAWINECTDENDVQTWYGADPTLM